MEKDGEKQRCEKYQSVSSYTCPKWGLSPQSRLVPRLGIELATFQFTG